MNQFNAKDYESTTAYISDEYMSGQFTLDVEFGNPAKTRDRYYIFRGIVKSDELVVPIDFEWKSGMDQFKSRIQSLVIYDGIGVFLDPTEKEGYTPNTIVNLSSNKMFTLYLKTSDLIVPSGKVLLTVRIGDP